jgi:hypothetical protein
MADDGRRIQTEKKSWKKSGEIKVTHIFFWLTQTNSSPKIKNRKWD